MAFLGSMLGISISKYEIYNGNNIETDQQDLDLINCDS